MTRHFNIIMINKMSVRKQIYESNYNPYDDMKQILPFDDHGWGSYSKAFENVIERIKPKLIVEIGTWFGCSARNMTKLALKYNPDVEIVCIDTFLGSVEHWSKDVCVLKLENGRPNIYTQFLSNNIHSGLTKHITPFPIDSINGYEFLKRFNIEPDLVYIDAGHSYLSVKHDLICWSERVRAGGIVMGDDYGPPAVLPAVADVLGPVEIIEDKFIWVKAGLPAKSIHLPIPTHIPIPPRVLLLVKSLIQYCPAYYYICQGLLELAQNNEIILHCDYNYSPIDYVLENTVINLSPYILEGEQLKNFAHDCDIIIYVSRRNTIQGLTDENSPPSSAEISPEWISKVIYIDSNEVCWVGVGNPVVDSLRKEPFNWEYMIKHCQLYAKRECYPQDCVSGCIPFALGTVNGYFRGKKDKIYDIFCHYGQTGFGLRSESKKIARRLKEEGYKVFMSDVHLPMIECLDIMAQSRIVIDSQGSGQNNIRMWEAVANNCLLFRQKYDIVLANDYTSDEIVEYSSVEELYELLKKYLQNPQLVAEMASRALEKTLRYHTPKERIKYLLKVSQPDFKANLQQQVQQSDCSLNSLRQIYSDL